MQYNRLGDTGLVVSRLAFGAMTFGSGQGALGGIWQVGQKDADALVGRALEAGINFFDTADSYALGESEEILGRALGAKRKEVVISTKVGFRTGDPLIDTGGSYRHILSSLEGSLRRLGTDYVDVYILHRRDPLTPLEESARALEDAVRRGMVRYVGYSNFPAWEAAKLAGIQRANGWMPIRAAQMYYSLVGRDIEHDTVPFTRDAGVGIMVWSPLAGGFLSGRYTRESPDGGGGRLASFDFIPTDREQGWKTIDAMKEIARAHGGTPAQVAIAWLLAKPHVATVLLGASKMHQLEDNLGAATLRLSADEVARLDELTQPRLPYPNWFIAGTGDAAVQAALAG